MMGRNHLITGSAATFAALSWLFTLHSKENYTLRSADGIIGGVASRFGVDTADTISDIGVAVSEWVLPLGTYESPAAVLYLIGGIILMLAGSVMPDMDVKTSWMGRRWPGRFWRAVTRKNSPHRGLTHSVWIQILLFAVAIPEPTRILLFFWFGWSTHCLMDMLGRAGRVMFYPLGRYRVITLPSGSPCVVQTGGRRGLYRTGHKSETVVMVGAVLVYLMSASLIWFWH